MKAVICALLAAALIAGCQPRNPAPGALSPALSPASGAVSFPELREFTWGRGRIVRGQTKAAVARQIALTWAGPV